MPPRSPPMASTPTIRRCWTEDVPPRGTERHYYSAQKAELEPAPWPQSWTAATPMPTCSGRASWQGPDALLLLENLPYIQLSERMPGPTPARPRADARAEARAARSRGAVPARPPRRRRHGDASRGARAAVTPGVYNLAGAGELTMSDLADALGWYSVPLPDIAPRGHRGPDRQASVPAARKRSGSRASAHRS